MPLRHFGFARFDMPRRDSAGQLLGRDLAVAVNQDHQRPGRLVLHHQRLDDGMQRQSERVCAPRGAAMIDVVIDVLGVRDAARSQPLRCRRLTDMMRLTHPAQFRRAPYNAQAMSNSSPRNPDLHCHSNVSDGTLAPDELARRAHAQGVDLWALTDHDELGGLPEAQRTAEALGMRFVPGVEISVSFAAQTVHIVALNIDPCQTELVNGLQQIRAGRDQRARDMAAALENHLGIGEVYAGALRFAGNPALLSRTHFARLLVEQGVCRQTHEVFSRFLTPGKPGYVEHEWACLDDALAWIKAAGGVAVIAHPGRYRFSATEEWALFDRFKSLGGQGIEVVTGSHTASQARKYAKLALEFGFYASRGSDFHSPAESICDLGRLAPLPADLAPVWDLLH